jgi:hypothetical protein
MNNHFNNYHYKKSGRIIVVLGMHRSGTSAIARGLLAIGVDLGDNLMPGVVGDNDKGFWEDMDIYALNADLLDYLGSDWQELQVINWKKMESRLLERYRSRAIELMLSKMKDAHIFGMKDPRIAILLPFWKRIFEELNAEVGYVIASRHPKSVAESLAKRNRFVPEKSYYLWLKYVISSMLCTADKLRLVVSYDLFMDEPTAQLNRIARKMNLPLNEGTSESVEDFKRNFLDEGLRHTRFDASDLDNDSTIPEQVITAYEMIEQLAHDESSLHALTIQETFHQLESDIRAMAPAFRYMSGLAAQVIRNEQIISEQNTLVSALNQTITARDGQIDLLVKAVDERVEHVGNLSREGEEKDNQIKLLNKEINKLEGQIEDIRLAIKEKEDSICLLNNQIAERNERINALIRSNSWRITKPFRLGKRLLCNILHPADAYRLNQDVRLIKESHLFDAEYYLACNRDILDYTRNPIFHYCKFGWKEGRNPSQAFNTRLYMLNNPDVAVTNINPLVHYLRYGNIEGRRTWPVDDK